LNRQNYTSDELEICLVPSLTKIVAFLLLSGLCFFFVHSELGAEHCGHADHHSGHDYCQLVKATQTTSHHPVPMDPAPQLILANSLASLVFCDQAPTPARIDDPPFNKRETAIPLYLNSQAFLI
jgi:hypothetical protein